jgi:hypothetical protein
MHNPNRVNDFQPKKQRQRFVSEAKDEQETSAGDSFDANRGTGKDSSRTTGIYVYSQPV